MTSPESFTIDDYDYGNGNATFLYDTIDNRIYVSPDLEYTMADGQSYSGNVSFDLCFGDDGTCVAIYTLSF